MTGALPYAVHETRTNRVMVWGCGTLLGMLAAEMVLGSYNAGLTSFKPAIFTLAVFLACTGLALMNRPRFAPVALLVLLLPAVRLFDAVVLARAESSYAQQTGMDHLRVMLELLAVLAVLATDQGQRAVLWAAMLAILLTTASEIGEMLGLAKFTSIPGRFAGFNGHPNFPPILLCEMLGIVFALSKNFRLNCVFIGISVVGVALTYGRAGMVVLVLMAVPYVLLNARRNLPFLLVIAALTVPVLGIGFAVLQSRTQQGVVK
ncbi:MAG TPA: hypothetical protein VD994_01875, partial [Prosthecobacter sp.]|nr:hypothetical protein [Prosthecobacter sp.]